jgi:energy-coupling factor transport system ATP-binding protein
VGVAAKLERYSYAWPGAEDWTLRELDLEFVAGECHLLSGASGSGKTTLALALKELLPPGRQAGSLRRPSVPGGDAAAVGLVLQNPETQILTDSIGAEVAFGLENLCLPPEQMPVRVRAALDAVGLELPFSHSTGRLSMGQKYRLLVAAQLVLEPRLLIIDEPAGQLDGDGLLNLASIIARLKRRGLAVLLCEHHPGPLLQVVDRHWHLDVEGCLQARPQQACESPVPSQADQEAGLTPGGVPAAEARKLSVAQTDATPVWQDADFDLQPGERVLLCASNGTGKTTLLRCLAGLLRPQRGEVRIFGAPPVPHQLRGRVGYLFQNPRRQLFETTVFNEVAFALRRLGISSGELSARVERTLERCGIAGLASRSPHQLSYGQQHLVALAAVLAPEPQLLLLDDPLAGLDNESATTVGAALLAASEERGAAIFWSCHHQSVSPGWSHRRLGIAGGALVPA